MIRGPFHKTFLRHNLLIFKDRAMSRLDCQFPNKLIELSNLRQFKEITKKNVLRNNAKRDVALTHSPSSSRAGRPGVMARSPSLTTSPLITLPLTQSASPGAGTVKDRPGFEVLPPSCVCNHKSRLWDEVETIISKLSETRGQSYRHFMLVNYNSRVVPTRKLLIL